MADQTTPDVGTLAARWDERAARYDSWYQTFKGAVEHHVGWKLLQARLPAGRGAKVLDVAGGTGRLTLLLAEMGYPVTLCDISSGMLRVARDKLSDHGMSDRVQITRCDACHLPFPEQSFDFVLSWGVGTRAITELARVTRSGGMVSICASGRVGAAFHWFRDDPEHALALLRSDTDHTSNEDGQRRVLSGDEASELLAMEGFRIVDLCAYDLWEALAIPQESLDSRTWDDTLFQQTAEFLTRLATDPSVRGLSKHLVIYAVKS